MVGKVVRESVFQGNGDAAQGVQAGGHQRVAGVQPGFLRGRFGSHLGPRSFEPRPWFCRGEMALCSGRGSLLHVGLHVLASHPLVR